MSQAPSDYYKEWKSLADVLLDRLRSPVQKPTFVFYFFFIIVFLGGVGIWVPYYKWLIAPNSLSIAGELSRAVSTYYVAILAAAFADLLLSNPPRPSLQILAFGLMTLGGAGVVVTHVDPDSLSSGIIASLGTLCSFALWWITNADNTRLLDPPLSPTAATGGNPHEQPSGSLDGLDA